MRVRTSRTAGVALLVAALGGALLAGCKSSGEQAAGSASPSPSATSGSGSASPSPSGTGSGAPSPSGSSAPGGPSSSGSTAPAGQVRTYTGTVVQGVEPGCVILNASDGKYELVGADATAEKVLRPQASVEVRGYLEHGMMSHCMQGKMLKVVSAKAR